MLDFKYRATKIELVIKTFSCLLTALLLISCSRSEAPAPRQSPPEVKAKSLSWYMKQYMADRAQWQLESEVKNPGFGMYELSQYPDKQATPQQKQKADELIEKTLNVAKARGWLLKEKALKDGFNNMYKDKIHYVNKEFLYDGKTLDPEAPEFLMYYPTEQGELLMGVMFAADTHGPQIGGPLTLWHYHVEQGICYENGLLPIGQVNDNGQCVEGVTRKKSPEMLHLWFFDHPDGRFATRMRLTDEQFAFAKEQILKLYQEAK